MPHEHGEYYVHGKTIYVVAPPPPHTPHVGKGWHDNFRLIPLQPTINVARYQLAHETRLDNPQTTRTIGHSLGGSVSFELDLACMVKPPFAWVESIVPLVSMGAAPPYHVVGGCTILCGAGSLKYVSILLWVDA